MLLQGRNGAGRRHPAGGSAVVDILVPGNEFQFVDLPLQHAHGAALDPAGHDGPQIVVPQASAGMDEWFRPVCKLVLVDSAVALDEKSRRACDDCVLHHGLVDGVNVALHIPPDVDVSVSRRRSVYRVERIQHEGIFPVVIQAVHLPRVLRGVDHFFPNKLAVVQDLPVPVPNVVVPVHHHALPVHGYAVVFSILVRLEVGAFQFPLQLRILLLHALAVHNLHVKQVLTVLNVLASRLPEQVQQADVLDVDVPDAAQLRLVPAHMVGRRAFLHFLPLGAVVGVLKMVDLQHRRNDVAQHLCLGLVLLHPRQDHRLRKRVHCVRVFADNAVPKPGRGALPPGCALRSPLRFDHFPVPQFPPLLGVDDPPVYGGLALLVFHELPLRLDQPLPGHAHLRPLLRLGRSCGLGNALRSHPRSQVESLFLLRRPHGPRGWHLLLRRHSRRRSRHRLRQSFPRHPLRHQSWPHVLCHLLQLSPPSDLTHVPVPPLMLRPSHIISTDCG